MKGFAEFVFETSSPILIYRALSPEMEDEIHSSNIEIVPSKDSISLKIIGEDAVSLRAAINTWIRLVKIAFEMVNI